MNEWDVVVAVAVSWKLFHYCDIYCAEVARLKFVIDNQAHKHRMRAEMWIEKEEKKEKEMKEPMASPIYSTAPKGQ